MLLGVLNGTVLLNSSLVCGGINGNLRDIYIASDNSIYVSCENPFIERWILENGTRSIVAGTAGQGSGLNQLMQPQGIFVDSLFNLYVADRGNKRVVKWGLGDSQGQVMINTTNAPQLQNPYELFVDESLMILYVSDSISNGLIMKLFLANGTILFFTGTFSSPRGLVVDENSRLYLVEAGGQRVLRFEPDGSSYTCIAACSGSSGTSASQLSQPTDVRFDQYGNLLVSDTNNDRIQKFLLISGK
jgi:tripartite motif-containing protein 71